MGMSEELKPVNCGCGGEAKVDIKLVSSSPAERKRIYCSKCYISTDWMKSEDEAIHAWNRAMGALLPEGDPQKNDRCEYSNTTERTAKVVKGSNGMITVAACGDCGTVVNIFDKYCARCGARLKWE